MIQITNPIMKGVAVLVFSTFSQGYRKLEMSC